MHTPKSLNNVEYFFYLATDRRKRREKKYRTKSQKAWTNKAINSVEKYIVERWHLWEWIAVKQRNGCDIDDMFFFPFLTTFSVCLLFYVLQSYVSVEAARCKVYHSHWFSRFPHCYRNVLYFVAVSAAPADTKFKIDCDPSFSIVFSLIPFSYPVAFYPHENSTQ